LFSSAGLSPRSRIHPLRFRIFGCVARGLCLASSLSRLCRFGRSSISLLAARTIVPGFGLAAKAIASVVVSVILLHHA
jgi:hypothetical protein